MGPGLTFNADDDFLGAKGSKLPDFSDLDKELQEDLFSCGESSAPCMRPSKNQRQTCMCMCMIGKNSTFYSHRNIYKFTHDIV